MRRLLLAMTMTVTLLMCATAGAATFTTGDLVTITATKTSMDGRSAEVRGTLADGRVLVIVSDPASTVTWRQYKPAYLVPKATPPPPPPPPPSDPPPTTEFPDATNTGVAGCGPLTPSSGMTIRTAGAVVQNLDSTGAINVQADNVTIRCVRIRNSDFFPLRLDGGTGTKIDRVEVDCANSQNVNSAIMGSDYTATAVNVHGCEDAFHVGQNTTITGSYVHDLLGPPECSSCHSDAIQATGYGGSGFVTRNIKITHNTLLPKVLHANAAIILKSDFGPISGAVIDGNLMNYGTYTVYSRDGGFGNPTGVQFVNNRFGHGYEFGLASIDGQATWTGNVWDDTGQPAG